MERENYERGYCERGDSIEGARGEGAELLLLKFKMILKEWNEVYFFI